MVQGVDAVKARNGRKAPVPAAVPTIVVDPDGNGDVLSIAEALVLLPPNGGCIRLAPGIHHVNQTLVINKSTRIEGAAWGDGYANPPQYGSVIYDDLGAGNLFEIPN